MASHFEPVPYPVFQTTLLPTMCGKSVPVSAAAGDDARALEEIALSVREIHGCTGPTAVFFLNVAGLEQSAGGGYAAHMAVSKSNAIRTAFERGADDLRLAGKCFGHGLLQVDVSGVTGGVIHGTNAPAAVFFNAAGEVVSVIRPGTDATEATILTAMKLAFKPDSLDEKLAIGREAIQAVRMNSGLRFQLDGKHAALARAAEAERGTIQQEIEGIEAEIARLDQVIADYEAQLAPALR